MKYLIFTTASLGGELFHTFEESDTQLFLKEDKSVNELRYSTPKPVYLHSILYCILLGIQLVSLLKDHKQQIYPSQNN